MDWVGTSRRPLYHFAVACQQAAWCDYPSALLWYAGVALAQMCKYCIRGGLLEMTRINLSFSIVLSDSRSSDGICNWQLIYKKSRSEGRSSRGISSPGGGADQDQVFPCRVVSWCRVVVSSSGPKKQKICKFLHAPRTEDQKSKKSAKIDKNQKCPEWSKMTQNKVRRPPKLILDHFPKKSRKFSKNRRKIFIPKLFFPHVGPYSKASRPIFRPNWAKNLFQKFPKNCQNFAYFFL